MQYEDQFRPFELPLFGCSPFSGSTFQGTIFRFPLRSPEQALSSKLSKQSYDLDKAADLLSALEDEAQSLMLFLKSISRISVFEWKEGSSSQDLLFSCSIVNISKRLEFDRLLFTRVSSHAMEALTASDKEGRASEASALLHQGSQSIYELHINKESPSKAVLTSYRFLVSCVAAGGEAVEKALDLSKTFAAPLVPFGAVAAEISLGGFKSEGQTFCFLPLPAKTGLPLAGVNGFFELSSNRRDVWHGSDLVGIGR